MKNSLLVMLLGMVTFSADLFAGTDVVIKEYELESCLVDTPFNEALITYRAGSYHYGPFCWANYPHVYITKTKKLIVAISEKGQIYEREIVAKTSHEMQVTSYENGRISGSCEQEKARLMKSVNIWFTSRLPMQCD